MLFFREVVSIAQMSLAFIFNISASGIKKKINFSNYREYLVWRHKAVYFVIIINGVIVPVT